MNKAVIEVTGETIGDVVQAIQAAAKEIRGGKKSGFCEEKHGECSFQVTDVKPEE